MTAPSPNQAVLTDLRRATTVFKLRAIVTAMGVPAVVRIDGERVVAKVEVGK